MTSIRTRFAPSPTGYLHVGGARTALYNYLYARQLGGSMILRIEDTDLERSTEASIQAILDGMYWLGLEHDEGPFYQTKRFDRYREVVQQLLDNNDAYHCYCSQEELDTMREEARQRGDKPRYDGRCRHRTEPREGVNPVVRFKNPEEGSVIIDDMVYGRIEVANKELDDLIIARSSGVPTYNLTVVVDDVDMEITHVIRGDDHINNTSRQINLYQAMGAALPQFAHLPMILGTDGKRLSKRHGAVGVMQFETDGYLPEALLNYLVRLGWSYGDQEIFSMSEMIEHFAFENVSRGGSTFDVEKLNWVNAQYIKSVDGERLGLLLTKRLEAMNLTIVDQEQVTRVADLMRDRASTLVEMAQKSRFFFEAISEYDPKAIKKHFKASAAEPLKAVREALAQTSEWQPEVIEHTIAQTVEHLEVGFGKVGLPLRIATTGGTASPALDQTLSILGQVETLKRIDAGLDYLNQLE